MRILFCGDPLNGRRPDPDYGAEASAAQAADLDFSLINYEALVDDDVSLEAIRRVPAGAGHELGIYRGWMLKPAQYRKLFEALAGSIACSFWMASYSPAWSIGRKLTTLDRLRHSKSSEKWLKR